MTNKTRFTGPVAVGGLGGSGTRVVAEILKGIGFYIGNDLNFANDNLWFTLLFKRPKWFIESSNREIFKAFRIFEKTMTGCLYFQRDEVSLIMRAVFEIALFGHDYLGRGRGTWPIRRAIKMFRLNKIDLSAHCVWGWKEPNSHIYIKYLNQYFDSIKYIHVIRHGLDMRSGRGCLDS